MDAAMDRNPFSATFSFRILSVQEISSRCAQFTISPVPNFASTALAQLKIPSGNWQRGLKTLFVNLKKNSKIQTKQCLYKSSDDHSLLF